MQLLATLLFLSLSLTLADGLCSGYCNAACNCPGNKLSYQCKDGVTCIDMTKYRDSQCDCPDCSDEDCCDWHYKCDQWRGSFKCISTKLIDNGVADCNDMSDETKISEDNCTALEKVGEVYSCNTQKNGPKVGKCILSKQLMDGTLDCPLGDDEDSTILDLCYMRKSTCNLKHTNCVKDTTNKKGYKCVCLDDKQALKADGTCG